MNGLCAGLKLFLVDEFPGDAGFGGIGFAAVVLIHAGGDVIAGADVSAAGPLASQDIDEMTGCHYRLVTQRRARS
jgi:hypothetical protein